MKTTSIFNGKVVDGKLMVDNRERFAEHLRTLSGEVVVSVKKKRKIRSLNANNYYWLILTIAGDELGYDPKELHDSFKALYLTDQTTKIPLIRSTSKLNTEQFSQYLEKVIRQLAELGIVIPSLEEYYSSTY